MRFDREAPGGGVEIYCDVQMGKAILEWKFYCTQPCSGMFIKLYVWDEKGRFVLEGRQLLEEEELFRTVFLHPHLWNGTEDPYLYRAEAVLAQEGQILDRLSLPFPIRSFRKIPGKGWFLNGEAFVKKAVRFESLPECEWEGNGLEEHLELLLRAGANTLCISEPRRQPASFYEICEEKGFVIWSAETEKEIDSRLFVQDGRPSDTFYRCMAAWSEEPFVYISRESLKCQENGNYSVTVYSNQKKAALYVDGTLFEFQSGEKEFLFREIPFSTLFLCLTAEAEECVMSLAVHRIFTKASLFHDN